MHFMLKVYQVKYKIAFWGNLVLALHRGDKVKHGLLSKHLFQRKQQYGGWKTLKITSNFYKK